MPPNPKIEHALELVERGRYAEARQRLMPLVAREPGNVPAKLGLAVAHLRSGFPAMAALVARALLQGNGLDDAQSAAACETLFYCGHEPEAMNILITTVGAQKGWVACRSVLANWYNAVGEHERAQTLARENLERFPEREIDARYALGDAGRALGDFRGAMGHYRAVQWMTPEDPSVAQSIAFISNGIEEMTPAQSYQAHVKFARIIENATHGPRYEFPAVDDPERRLRVGFVSHDFNRHAVGCFLEGPLRHLDRAGFEVWGYYTAPGRDASTERLAGMCDRFVHTPGITAADLAARVHADRMDILIDLNGLTLGHRLGAFALKPAPVQGTYLGYPNTTGLRAIDCRFVDAISDGADADAAAAERLVRLDPCFLCYTPLQERADIMGPGWKPPAWEPAAHVRFGCFNNSTKFSDAVLAMWGAVLRGVPGSMLTIKSQGLIGSSTREALTARLRAAGVPVERVVLVPPTPTMAEHIACYGGVDIALDTFPYNGTTTTCEALCCGVPVVACLGDRHGARVTASILRAAGLPELVAPSRAAMVDIAVALAGDTPRLHALRSGLTERFRASAVCDGPAFGRRMGTALREEWRRRCREGVKR